MGTGSLVWPLIRFLLAFALVVALAALASRWLASRARGSAALPLQMLGGLSLGAGRQICLVRLGRRVLVLGLADKQVRLLERIVDPDEVAELMRPPADSPTAPFAGFLAEALSRARAHAGGRFRDR